MQALCQYNTKQLYDYEFMVIAKENWGKPHPASSIIRTFAAVLQELTQREEISIGSRAYIS